ncbi:FAD-binding protein [Pseudoroseicyclus tamaricis]|uniref:FAD-binding protein n=1 Tax=Pseudoroseicyclus tamaricis TaxID=2705421 RepID=A0A6B2JLE5_9RHOB|nr:FAD-binding protein [Pseudoroseicyclus tamaricis]NDV02373.1 FAD-binding protein [Pseudoroseicyclus tamaricis]
MREIGSEEELAELLAGRNAPLSVGGGFTRGMTGEGERLSAAGLTGIRLYEPGALTLVAGAGTPLAEVEAALAAEGQRLAFEPMDHRGLLGTSGQPTIGGVVAGNVSGPRRVVAGAARDFCLGVRFVDGRGHVVKNGGRVMKNVTGYDLVKLMAGSRGRLGVITEVSLKVLPVPETEVTLAGEGGVPVLAAALGSPFEVTGAAVSGGRTLIRLEGLAESVAYRQGALAARLGGDWEVLEGEASAALWRGVRDVAPFHGKEGAVWRVAVRPGRAPELLEALGEEAVVDWGGGLVWLLVGGDGRAEEVRAAVERLGGHATLVRRGGVPAGVPALQPEPAGVARLTGGLTRAFDPRGIFAGAG